MYTYTASTAARAAMLAAGWFIGPGCGTGPKAETTIAYSPAAAESIAIDQLFDSRWLDRWSRSDAQLPLGETSVENLELIRRHPQFASRAL